MALRIIVLLLQKCSAAVENLLVEPQLHQQAERRTAICWNPSVVTIAEKHLALFDLKEMMTS